MLSWKPITNSQQPKKNCFLLWVNGQHKETIQQSLFQLINSNQINSNQMSLICDWVWWIEEPAPPQTRRKWINEINEREECRSAAIIAVGLKANEIKIKSCFWFELNLTEATNNLTIQSSFFFSIKSKSWFVEEELKLNWWLIVEELCVVIIKEIKFLLSFDLSFFSSWRSFRASGSRPTLSFSMKPWWVGYGRCSTPPQTRRDWDWFIKEKESNWTALSLRWGKFD